MSNQKASIADLKLAYETLINEESRKEYDHYLNSLQYPWYQRIADEEKREEIERRRRERQKKNRNTFNTGGNEDYFDQWTKKD